jgi:signal transduction histidine kinase
MESLEALAEDIEKLKTVILSRQSYEARITSARELIAAVGETMAAHRRELAAARSPLRMVDLFAVVDRVVEDWRAKVEAVDVEVTTRIPVPGPPLLMNRRNIEQALRNILSTLTSCVRENDRVMVECSTSDDKAMVCIADTGAGLPGNLLSRLFMPFAEVDSGDEYKSAMSLAGDIVHRHSGEIMVKSSPSWRTILVITFPLAANRDRRRTRSDRRRRSADRRHEPSVSH